MGNKIDRRDFLSLMGLGGAAAVTMSCGDSPNFDETWHPWVEPVEGTIPYIPNFYATTTHESDGMGLRVRTIEGRATLVHGNPEHPLSHGEKNGVGTITARQQSVIEDLYGPGRVRKPRLKGGKEITWRQAGAMLEEKINGAKGKGVYALTGAFTGATAEIWTRFVAAMGTGKVVQYSAYAQSDQLLAAEKVFGRSEVPLVSLEGADMVLSLGAQFLETWGNVTDNSKYYGDMRTVDHGNRGKHVQIEARTSGTGANADVLLAARPGSETLIALALLKEVAGQATGLDGATKSKVATLTASASLESAAAASGLKAEDLKHVAEDLAHAKSAVVLPGESLSLGTQAVAHHAAVLLLNKALGGIGKHVNFEAGKGIDRVPTHQGIVDFTKQLQSGAVDLLIVKGTNPAYSLPPSLNFADALSKTFTIAFAASGDETNALADLVIPVTHDLESWGEVNTHKGIDMLMQPVMRPRWEAKQAEDHLIEWLIAADAEALPQKTFRAYLQASWTGRFGGDWREALKKGGHFDVAAGTDLPISGNLEDGYFGEVKSDGINAAALVLIDSARFGDGFAANRGWMQELPEWMTGVTWDSWLEMGDKKAGELGVQNGDIVDVKVGAASVSVPAFVTKTISDAVVILATGQGHTHFSEEYNRGVNAFALRSGELNDAGMFVAGPLNATFSRGTGSRKMATPHVPDWGDRKTTPLHTVGLNAAFDEPNEHYKRTLHRTIGADDLGHKGEHGDHHFDDAMLDEKSKFARHKSRLEVPYRGFYPDRDEDPVVVGRDETFYDPFKWEMAVDLNRCTGCGSCVTACYGENNLPVVGRDEVIKGREMAWVRINRYLEFTEDGKVEVGMMPMMCQQCGNAPCESVCPSLATYHSKEGLNAMVYNRCVGTRYCSNNCSYKVRRFNWYTWEFPGDMRWQMNPAVSVRQKGVMEKCTFCQQRIRAAKSVARDQGMMDRVPDGAVTTACQDACPSQAISFGNIKDTSSNIAKAAHDERGYKALDAHLHTKPGVTYLKRVTLGGGGSHG